LFQLEWTPVTGTPSQARIAVLGELDAPGERFAALAALEKAREAGADGPDLVPAAIDGAAGEDPARAAGAVAGRTLALAQLWLAREWLGEATLVAVTRNGVAGGCESVDLAHAP
ncbi:hypothetical protein VM98_36170, partial [Streptomyces rubellomurinus subsp. indigoferus]